MLLTEEEAKTKWCPAARVSDAGLGNRYTMVDDLTSGMAFAHCIASRCMWWRWGVDETRDRHRKPDGTVEEYRHKAGYCGIAGKPDLME